MGRDDPQRLPRKDAKSLRRDAARVVEGDIGWQARVLARRLAAYLDGWLASTGLSSAQFTLMCLIAAAPDDSIGALAAKGGFDQSTLSRNVDGLTRAGLVEVVTAEADRRRRAVWLTEAGARALEAAMPLWHRAHDDLAASLGATVSGLEEALAAATSRAAPLR